MHCEVDILEDSQMPREVAVFVYSDSFIRSKTFSLNTMIVAIVFSLLFSASLAFHLSNPCLKQAVSRTSSHAPRPLGSLSPHARHFMSAQSESAGTSQQGRVTMYFKESCPFCKKSRELLEGKYHLKIDLVDVESKDNLDEILYQMKTFSGGRNTVPQIFFNSEHIGGNDDLQKLEESGALAGKIETLRSTPVGMMMPNWYHPWY